ncbi:hypothetical protein BJ875DRAFT_386887 [Amylocarpus encephaloides]|uniref:3-beta hydroxysteroid dehydrogenase/isomerase domain-containing protein n=1 Tax=Amylocarpus encephaloides TaxID=45428 RepID=A0A9P8C0V3_9HELO|nr:hypothetical protein BJ875DRAFT_386887 [Amylocarpus encephaloides]
MADGVSPNLDHVLVIGGCGFLIVQALRKHPPCPTYSVANRSPTRNLIVGIRYHANNISK